MHIVSRFFFLAGWLLVFAGCSGPQPVVVQQPEAVVAPVEEPTDRTITDRTIEVTILQLNDVYEITPVEGGKRGGLARVATVRKQLIEENPHTITVIAGDFFSPSALGTARVDGERLAGKQMVAVLNALGLDLATFGNHEFDIDERQFLQRLEESAFPYLAGNVFDRAGDRFPNSVPHTILAVPGQPGDTLRLGLVGVTITSNAADYVRYTEPMRALEAEVERIEDDVDALVGLTHLSVDEDIEVAATFPQFDLIMGGHEHENIQIWRGPDLTPIAKADANARTVYIHRLRFDPETEEVTVTSHLKEITDAIPDDPEVAQVVDEWLEVGFEGFRQSGLEPGAPVAVVPEPLDGRESSVRNEPTNLAALIADAMLSEADAPDLAVFNSGSIRIDDVISPGTVIQYDIIRVLPFGGAVLTAEIRGDVLRQVLTQGVANKGTGGYLQTANVEIADDGWLVGGAPIDPERWYRVAINDFLMTGYETGLDYLTDENPGVRRLAEHGDIRLAVIAEMQRRYANP